LGRVGLLFGLVCQYSQKIKKRPKPKPALLKLIIELTRKKRFTRAAKSVMRRRQKIKPRQGYCF
jgi:hypothetical protein